MSFNLKPYLSEKKDVVERALRDFLPSKGVFPDRLHESMHYSLFAGGKRIRPILCMAAAEACGGNDEVVMHIACALEMIHTFSLIHDDLPAMDDDSYRRGQQTNHKVFGEAIAILAGDALVTQAFLVLAQMSQGGGDPKKILEISKDIAEATGSLGMVGGQVVDLESENKKLDLESLRRLHLLKTERLITVSIVSGAKMVTDQQVKIAALEKYGKSIGLAFQVADDILDIEGGEDLGKDIGSDVEKNKATYPAVMGLQEAKGEASRLCEEALAALNGFGVEAEPLRAIARYIVERRN